MILLSTLGAILVGSPIYVSERDQQVLLAVAICALADPTYRKHADAKPDDRIILAIDTSGKMGTYLKGRVSPNELQGAKANYFARQPKKGSAIRFKSPRAIGQVVLGHYDSRILPARAGPGWQGYALVGLPGYSKDGQLAYVAAHHGFWSGWHEVRGEYILTRKSGKWIVSKHRIDFTL